MRERIIIYPVDLEKILEKLKDVVLGEIKEELRDFKVSVSGELSGYRLAIESMNARMAGIEARMSALEERQLALERKLDETNKRIDELSKRIDETNKRIDETRAELKAEIMQNTIRIDETNKRIDEIRAELKYEIRENTARIDQINSRIDYLHYKLSEISGELKEAISNKEIINDILLRVERLESKLSN